MVNICAVIVVALWGASAAMGEMLPVHANHVGCFQDRVEMRDLPHKVEDHPEAVGNLEGCVRACTDLHFMFSGLQNGKECFCGPSYGRYGPGQCTKHCLNDPDEVCGGETTNAVYRTGLKVPGPPSALKLLAASEKSLRIAWTPDDGVPQDFITSFKIVVAAEKSFSAKRGSFAPNEILTSGKVSTVIGLHPGTLYNVSVSASSTHGFGLSESQLFWTEISEPEAPETPVIVQHDDHEERHADAGEIHIKFRPLDRNDNGPISAYRVVVINATEPAPFYVDNLGDWRQSRELGIPYWIAAEIGPEWFDFHEEFVVGDGRTYGGYLNYGPLPGDQDFHITAGTVSTLNNITKVSYAPVTHDQHHPQNIVVFKFHQDDHDHDGHEHGHSHGHSHSHNNRARTRYHHVGDSTRDTDKKLSSTYHSRLDTGLIVCIVIASILLVCLLVLYVSLRCWSKRRNRQSPDTQELTAATTIADSYAFENHAADSGDPLDKVRKCVWQIPRNFLVLSHEVIGKGKYGSVIKGQVNRGGLDQEAKVHVIAAGSSLSHEQNEAMSRDLEMVVRCGSHENIVGLWGVCEEKDTVFVVLEPAIITVKQRLLDSRALIHNPPLAHKSGSISSLSEVHALQMLRDVASGMSHISSQLYHRHLCARNVFCVGEVAKVGGFGILESFPPGQEADATRWTSPEALRSRSYAAKCDVWSFACCMWEVATLGATPYFSIKTNREVANRVSRGHQLHRPGRVSDDIYQLMLTCWQTDLDERPNFHEILAELQRILDEQRHMKHLDFSLGDGDFEYEPFSNDLEILSAGPRG